MDTCWILEAGVDYCKKGVAAGDRMKEDFLEFYALSERNEFQRIIENKTNPLPDDFLHCEFCASVLRHYQTMMLKCNLYHDDIWRRYWAAVLLRQSEEIKNTFFRVWN